jgi:WD40 repeat protein
MCAPISPCSSSVLFSSCIGIYSIYNVLPGQGIHWTTGSLEHWSDQFCVRFSDFSDQCFARFPDVIASGTASGAVQVWDAINLRNITVDLGSRPNA